MHAEQSVQCQSIYRQLSLTKDALGKLVPIGMVLTLSTKTSMISKIPVAMVTKGSQTASFHWQNHDPSYVLYAAHADVHT